MCSTADTTNPLARFHQQVKMARKCAPGGYLTKTDIKGLHRRGSALGLTVNAVEEIIASSAETWRIPPQLLNQLRP